MTQLERLRIRLKQRRKITDQKIAETRILASKGIEVRNEIALLANDIELYNKVAATLASVGEQRQADAQRTIEELVTRGLSSIFSEELVFSLVQTQRGKTPEVKFLVKSRGLNGASVETSVMDSRGGGLAAVVGFLLRLVVLLLKSDNRSLVLNLDESFSHVSAEFERPLAEFIRELVDKTQVQINLVTHSDAFNELADKRFKVEQKQGVSTIKEF